MIDIIIFLFLITCVFFFSYFIHFKKNKWWQDTLLKSLGVALFILSIYKLFHVQEIRNVIRYEESLRDVTYLRDPFNTKSEVITISIVEAIVQGGLLLGIIAPFFYQVKRLRFAGIVGTITGGVIELVFCNQLVFGFLARKETNNLLNYALILEAFLMILIGIILIVKAIETKEKINERDMSIILIIYFLSILMIMPNHTPKAIFGLPTFKYMNYSPGHINILAFTLISMVLLIVIFKHKETAVKQALLVSMSIACFYTFFNYYDWKKFTQLTSLPLHLCHTAVILMPVAIIFKIKPIFYFTYFINVLGAFAALVFPSISNASFYENESIRFWYNHYYDFVIPIVAVGIKVFPRPKMKHVVASLGVFTVYFVAIMAINTVFVTLPSGQGTDYFFLNGDVLADKINILKRVKVKFVWEKTIQGVKHYRLFWMYDLLVYVGFTGLTFLCLFMYEYLYSASDLFDDMLKKHQKRRKLLEDKNFYKG